jgi:Zn-dependent protease
MPALAKERRMEDRMRAVQDSNDPQPPQRPQIIFRIPPNVQRGPETPFQEQEPKTEGGWKKALGPLAFIGVLLLKFAAPILKFFPFILKTGGTMLISIGVYAMMWGWKFAAGFVLLIFVHEMGHVMAARKFGVPVSAPMFIPFMGAFIALKGRMKNAYEEAEIGIGGPLWGSAGAAVCHAAGLYYNIPILVALAWSAYWLNLFNLIPVGQLDGGHIAQALSPWMWLVGFAIMVWLAFMRPNFIIVLLLLMSLPRLMSLFRKRTEEEVRFYEITPAQRMKMALMYFGLIGALVYQMHAAHVWLAPFHKQ